MQEFFYDNRFFDLFNNVLIDLQCNCLHTFQTSTLSCQIILISFFNTGKYETTINKIKFKIRHFVVVTLQYFLTIWKVVKILFIQNLQLIIYNKLERTLCRIFLV